MAPYPNSYLKRGPLRWRKQEHVVGWTSPSGRAGVGAEGSTTGDDGADDKARAAARLLSRWRFFFKVLLSYSIPKAAADGLTRRPNILSLSPVLKPHMIYDISCLPIGMERDGNPNSSTSDIPGNDSAAHVIEEFKHDGGNAAGSPGQPRCIMYAGAIVLEVPECARLGVQGRWHGVRGATDTLGEARYPETISPVCWLRE
ncbi:hypothetical protein FIBSPDRAFT_259895 [Athelia psychrophila]|uniref:Uncharacterized protein n=1 Tax=Athelia psychrophila TaxID=1759441 RepID=A0A166RPP4_9AGAM|nr:hypothetical protein FIBSPDRAFT_259895 [Fibularhizoctonia sp. CBS 109695]